MLKRPAIARDLIDTAIPSFERAYGDHRAVALGDRACAIASGTAASATSSTVPEAAVDLARRGVAMYRLTLQSACAAIALFSAPAS